MMWRQVGIVGSGAYVPDFRIPAEVIERAWRDSSQQTGHKSVANSDEDSVTMGIEAGRAAIKNAGIDPADIGTVWVGTESKPYAAKAAAATIAEAVGATPWVSAADLEFACRGGVEGLLGIADRVQLGRIRYGLLVAVDAAQGEPGDQLELTAGAGAAALVLGPSTESRVVLSESVSFVTDTPDFFRRDGVPFPTHAHRFTGQPAYFHHVCSAVSKFLDMTETRTSDYRYVLFHQPNMKFPREAARVLGISADKVEPMSLFDQIGNTYAACVMLSLVRALESLQPDELVLISSYGSGAGSDCFAIRGTKPFERSTDGSLEQRLRHFCELQQYGEYLKLSRQIGDCA